VEFPVEISLSPIETAEGVLISSTIRDVSERNRLGTAPGERNLQLETADQAKDLFLANMKSRTANASPGNYRVLHTHWLKK